jgi:tetratricopeptide (TPR) repeat protein
VKTQSPPPPALLEEALLHHRKGELREAAKLYERVLKKAPQHFDALHLLGLVNAQQGRMGEAFRLMSAALKLNPNAPDAWSNLANVLRALRQGEQALAAVERALALRPADLTLMQQRGAALVALGRMSDACACLEAVVARDAGQAEAWLNLGVARAALGDGTSALAAFDTAIRLSPRLAEAHYNRGTAFLSLGRCAEALAALDQALALAPEHLKALSNKGRALQQLGRHKEATACFETVIARDPKFADAHFNLSMSLLSSGDLARGFREYEWRWKRTGMTAPKFAKPLWLGGAESRGRRVLLHAEQGLGDAIQFVRYVPFLAETAAAVHLQVQPELKALFAALPGVTGCTARGEPLPDYDLHCPFGSLPLAFSGRAIPATTPYLAVDDGRRQQWQARLAKSGRRVALAWRGNAQHPNDRNRSVAIELLAQLFDLQDVTFVTLQPGLTPAETEIVRARGNVVHLGDDVSDMADSAAILGLCDLTIAVDTSLAHLAGALARPLWLLLPAAPDWRWACPDDKNLWYPAARLFRQAEPGDWSAVIADVERSLAQG